MQRNVLMALVVVAAAVAAGCDRAPVNVGVIDVAAVARALGRDDVMTAQVTEVNRSLQAQLLQRSELIRAQLQTQRDALGEDASEEAMGQFEETLREANEEFDKIQRTAVVRSRQVRDALVTKFRREVTQVAQEVASTKGLRAIFSSDATLLWYEPALDITDEVIAEMRARAQGVGGTGAESAPAAGGDPGR